MRPRWIEFISEADREYCSALFADFIKRAQTDPDVLFDQLCSLSVGPLITFSTGKSLAESREIAPLWENFLDLSRG